MRQNQAGPRHIGTTPTLTRILDSRWDRMSESERVDMVRSVFEPSRMADINRLMMR